MRLINHGGTGANIVHRYIGLTEIMQFVSYWIIYNRVTGEPIAKIYIKGARPVKGDD